jgi:hypothetical protein
MCLDIIIIIVEHGQTKAFLGLENPAQLLRRRAFRQTWKFNRFYFLKRLEPSEAIERLERFELSGVLR